MRYLLLLLSLVFTTSVKASTIMDNLDINGFGTFAYQRSDSDAKYYDTITNENNFFLGTKAGLTISKRFSREWDFMLMYLAKADEKGKINSELDILQVEWRPNSDFLGRIGRFRLPVWMISEYLEVGALVPWIRPPDEVYATIPLDEVNGLNASYNFEFSNFFFNFDVFGGVGVLETSGASKVEGTLDDVIGGVLSLTYDFLTFRTSYTQGIFEADVTTTSLTAVPSAPGSYIETTVKTDFNLGRVNMLSTGLKSEWKNTFIMAEYAKWTASSSIVKENQGYYILGGYYFFDRKLFPHFTFARTTKVESTLTFYQGRQKSYILGMNYSINQNLISKLELRRVKPEGEAFFDRDLMGEEVHMFGASIDFVF